MQLGDVGLMTTAACNDLELERDDFLGIAG